MPDKRGTAVMTLYKEVFDYWGHGLALECDDAGLLQRITDYINLGPGHDPSGGDDLCRFQLIKATEAETVLPVPGEQFRTFTAGMNEPIQSFFSIYAVDEIRYYDWSNLGRYRIDPRTREVKVVVYGDSLLPSIYQMVLLAEPAIRQLARDCFFVHAGCFCINRRGVLISGPSGAGKSTATFALAWAGIPVLTDEAAFVRRIPQGYEAWSLNRMIKIRRDAANRFFSDSAEVQTKYMGSAEIFYPVASLPQGKSLSRTMLRAIIAVVKTNEKDSFLRRVSPLKMVPAVFPVTLSNLDGQQRAIHFNKLTELLNHLECYQLFFGTDMDRFAAYMQEWTWPVYE
jgi:hypothetical protein